MYGIDLVTISWLILQFQVTWPRTQDSIYHQKPKLGVVTSRYIDTSPSELYLNGLWFMLDIFWHLTLQVSHYGNAVEPKLGNRSMRTPK